MTLTDSIVGRARRSARAALGMKAFWFATARAERRALPAFAMPRLLLFAISVRIRKVEKAKAGKIYESFVVES